MRATSTSPGPPSGGRTPLDFTFVAPVWPRAGGVSMAIEPEACDSFGAFSIGDGINDRGDLLVLDDKVDASGVCQIQVWIMKLASGEEFVGPGTGVSRQLNNNGVAVGQSHNRAMRWSPSDRSSRPVRRSDPAERCHRVVHQRSQRSRRPPSRSSIRPA